MQRFILIQLLVAISQIVFPIDYKPTAKYTISNNLTNSEITSLFVDSHQFLWIGTTDGLNRFDGYRFRKYYAETNNTNSLPDDNILETFEDRQGNIWCATAFSLVELNRKDDNFTSYFLNQTNNLDPQMPAILDVAFEKSGDRIFVLGRNFLESINTINKQIDNYLSGNGISKFLDSKFKTIAYNNKHKLLILANHENICFVNPEKPELQQFINLPAPLVAEGGILGALSGDDNNCFFYSKKHIWQLDIGSGNIKLLNLPEETAANQTVINNLSITKDNKLRVVTPNRILESQYGAIDPKVLFEFNLSETNKHTVRCEAMDDAGIWWLGTNKGLFKFNPHKDVFSCISVNNISDIGADDFICLANFIDDRNMLLLLNSGQLLTFNNYDKKTKRLDLELNNKKPQVYSIEANKTGGQLICTNKGLIVLNDYNAALKSFTKEDVYLEGQVVYAAAFDSNFIWTGGETGVYKIDLDKKSQTEIPAISDVLAGQPFTSVNCSENYVWIQQNHQIIEFDKKTNGVYILSIPALSNKSPSINAILPFENSKLIIGTSDGLFQYSGETKKLTSIDRSYQLSNSFVYSIQKSVDDKIWVSTNEGIISFDILTGKERLYNATDGMFISGFRRCFSGISPKGMLLFGGQEEMVMFYPDLITPNRHAPKIEFTEAVLSGSNSEITIYLDKKDTLFVFKEYSNIKIEFTALDFWDVSKNSYMYSFTKNGGEAKWEHLSNRNYINLSDLKSGYYQMLVRGSNNDGIWCDSPKALTIHIVGSVWHSVLSYIGYFLVFVFVFLSAVFFRTRHFRSLNRKYLEREQVTIKIEQQREELSQKNKNITDSLNYARRIQMALMPSQKVFTKYFPDSFILHMPKDIVSGDFYWVNEVDNRIYFAAVDCTGHGVPGAFMSIIGFELFRRITEMDKKKQPAIILDSLSQGFEHIFRDVESYTLRDGMDVAFCAIDKDMKVLEFAGAFNPLYIIRENTITEIKGDRFSVGLYGDDKPLQFKNHVIPLLDGDLIYIFTDGFADQFGGPEGKKYKYRRFRHLLLALHQLPMERQLEFLRRSINDWRGDLDQVDDVLVLGVRIQQTNK
jgi:serine phosphatase RsbU (regulator of sigma subunit)/ligand-binding sensor domain-containing protein